MNNISSSLLLQGDDRVRESSPDSSFLSMSPDPIGNTGSLVTSSTIYQRQFSSCLGWLSMSFRANGRSLEYDCIPALIAAYNEVVVADHIIKMGFPARGYKAAAQTLKGTLFAWTIGRDDYFISVPQSLLEGLSALGQIELAKSLLALGGSTTRIDINVDNTTGDLTVNAVRQAMEAPRLETLSSVDGVTSSKARYYVGKSKDFEPRGKQLIHMAADKGMGVSIGNRASNSFIRVYDKAAESSLDYACTRIELELKKSHAHVSLLALIDAATSSPDLVGQSDVVNEQAYFSAMFGMIVDRIDFRDRAVEKNVSRCPRLPWWDKFCAGVNKLQIRVPSVRPIISECKEWLVKNVAPVFAVVYFAIQSQAGIEAANEFVEELLFSGVSRWKARHESLYAAAPDLYPQMLPDILGDCVSIQ